MVANIINNTIPNICGFAECSKTWLGSVSLWMSIIATGELLLIIILIIIIFKLLKRSVVSGGQPPQ